MPSCSPGWNAKNLHPSPEADRETLLRRVTLDLTGLPPTPAEIDAFLNDKSDRRLRKSCGPPARLAALRRAHGRAAGSTPPATPIPTAINTMASAMWRWRDWVIDAFNRNQPFNQFTLEQIAGDMLPNATLDQKIATGFNRNHRANTEDGIVPEEYARRIRRRPRRDHFDRLPRPHARLRPLPQPQIRPVHAERVLPGLRLFQQVPEMGRGMKYGNSPPLVPAPTADQQQELDKMNAEIAVIEKTLADRASRSGTHRPSGSIILTNRPKNSGRLPAIHLSPSPSMANNVKPERQRPVP